MIRDHWYVVLESKDVPAGKAVGVKRLGEDLVFWRTRAGQVVCMYDRCPHLSARLSQGHIQPQDHLACPFHGFEFDPGGRCRYVPALGRNAEPPKILQVPTYPTYEAHGLIWIWWGEPRENLTPPAWFDIGPEFSYCGYQDVWPVHYSRMIENQLDVMHLPFVHYNTIGRGQRVVVDGPLVREEGDKLQVWVFNRRDDGTPPRRAAELPAPTRPPFLEFLFPNLWQNRISDEVRIVVAFVPVDEENARMILRFYQRFVRLPFLRDLVNRLGCWSSRYIANQDKRVVSQQRPKRSALRSDEHLLRGDGAVLAYRRLRDERLAQVASRSTPSRRGG